ncbi:MAG: MFS transporter [Burkholderiales bacterium]|nr:MFS transporter [Burkholderiales bacterium]
MALGGLLSAVAGALIPFATSAGGLYAALAVAAAAGAALGGAPTLLAAVAARVPAGRHGFASGVISAGGPAGQLVLAPAAQALTLAAGWTSAMIALAALSLAALPLARAFRRPARPTPVAPRASAPRASSPPAVRDALANPSYWLIGAAFFVCGFHVTFLLTHMPGVIERCGLPASLSGASLAVMGLFNVVGSIVSGALTQRVPMRLMLAALYGLRALGVAAFLLAPKTEAVVLGFSVWMGLTYMATLPPTAGLIGKLFGARHLGLLLGLVFFVHQLGAFAGAWLGGIALEATGSFDALWQADIALAACAALIALAIRERTGAAPSARARGREGDPLLAGILANRAQPGTMRRLRDGRRVRVRPAAPRDAAAIQAFVRGLSDDTRRSRFFGSLRELPPAMLERMTGAGQARDVVLLALAGPAGEEAVVGLGQYAAQPDSPACELALVVDDAWQGSGLGRILIERLFEAARRAGFGRVEGDVLPANRSMVALARASGFEVAHNPEDPTLLQIVRRLPARTPAALREWLPAPAYGMPAVAH